MNVGRLSFVRPFLTSPFTTPPVTSSMISSIVTLTVLEASPITLLSLPGLLGLFGLMISAVTLLSLPGFRSTGISILPLSISSWLIGFSVFLPLSSVTTTLSPGFTEPSFGIVTSTVVLPASLSPALFSSSEILPSLFVSSGNLISGLLGFLLNSLSSERLAFDESLTLPASSANLYSGVSYFPSFSLLIPTLNVASNLPSLIISSVISTNLTQLPLPSIDWITSPAFTLPSVGMSITQ